jgi:magnesium chelatase family protein
MNNELPLVPDWADMRGHYHARRMLEVAASGGHSILLVGPPKAGKAAMARSLKTILPPPFIAPHPPTDPLPSAVEQARGGMLFLKDLDEWDDPSLALLRETVGREGGLFLLVATTRNCPCGRYADEAQTCTCQASEVETHQQRLGETIDACFALEACIPSVNRFASSHPDESSRAVRERVDAARLNQLRRNGARLNRALSLPEVEARSPLDMPAQMLLGAAHRQLSLSPRQELYLRQVARTIADLDGEGGTGLEVGARHLAEAIQYRPRWLKRAQ